MITTTIDSRTERLYSGPVIQHSSTKHNQPSTSLHQGERAGHGCLWAVILSSLLAGCVGTTVPVKPPSPPSPLTQAPVTPAARGGSNLLSFTVGAEDGYIAKFDTSTQLITQQLQQMYAAGQRRLKIPILFYHQANDGLALDSTGGVMNLHDSSNLLGLLQLIKNTGFDKVEVQFLPEWWNDPEWWVNPGPNNNSTYGNCVSRVVNPDGTVAAEMQGNWYVENWSFIANARTLLLTSKMPYVVDLMNEALETRFVTYGQRLWVDYTSTFGKEDTLGFSVVPTQANLSLFTRMYSGNPPNVVDLHIYDNAAYGNRCDLTSPGSCTYAAFVGADAALKQQGYLGPVIVGEVFYNDPPTAQALVRARQATGRTIQQVTQWPLSRGFTTGQTENVIPVDFTAYGQAGF